MSVGYYVVGVKPPTEEYAKRVAVWQACEAAGVEIPDEVDDFFGGEEPDPTGMVVDLGWVDDRKPRHECATEWMAHEGEESGLEIEIAKLPEGVERIRVFLS
jgi:hypothetical protein